MEEKRKFNRWYVEKETRGLVSYAGNKEEVKLLNISAGGMRVCISSPVDAESVVHGEFKILPSMGPFFVRGKVKRVSQREGMWDTVVEFDKVSTMPLLA